MARQEKLAVIAGAKLIAAIGGPSAYTAFTQFVSSNFEAARRKATEYVKQTSLYDRAEKTHRLPDLTARISRGPQWRVVDFAVEELVAHPNSQWVQAPETAWSGFLPATTTRVQERPTHEDLPDVYLQRIYSIKETWGGPTETSETFLVGSNQTFLPPEILLRKSTLIINLE